MQAGTGTYPLPGGTLEVRTHARKGRCLHTTRLVKGGEVVLEEEPVLLLVAPEMAMTTCATCLRAVGPQEGLPCSGCRQACFCSASCLQAAQSTPWIHSGPICSAYARLATLASPGAGGDNVGAAAGAGAGAGAGGGAVSQEELGQLRFLLHALALRHTPGQEAERRFASLVSLAGEPSEGDRALAARLGPLLGQVLAGVAPPGSAPPSLDPSELAALLRKEQLNSYGILAAPQQAAAAAGAGAAGAAERGQQGQGRVGGGGAARRAGEQQEEAEQLDGERRLRGSALYAQASLINHECLPNVARFDAFDSGRPGSTRLAFRALHDLPPGTELAQSYVPLHWRLAERQAQCREVYGFACSCPRCQTESAWSDDEGEGEESEWETDSGGAADMCAEEEEEEEEEDKGEEADGEAAAGEVEMRESIGPISAPPGEEGPLEPAYLRLFLLKYMCARPGCFGTAAPPAPGSPMLECNVCGCARSEQDFLRELEERGGPGRR